MFALQATNLDPWVVHRKRGVPEPPGQPAGALIAPRILADSLRGWILLLLAKPIGALASCYIDCHVKVSRGIVISMGSYIVPVLWERISSTPQYLTQEIQIMSTKLFQQKWNHYATCIYCIDLLTTLGTPLVNLCHPALSKLKLLTQILPLGTQGTNICN